MPPLHPGSLIPAQEGEEGAPAHPTVPSRIPAPQELLKKQKSQWENQICELSSWMGSREVWSLPENSAQRNPLLLVTLPPLQMPGMGQGGRTVPGFRAAGFRGSASTGAYPWCPPGCGGTGRREQRLRVGALAGQGRPRGSCRQQSSGWIPQVLHGLGKQRLWALPSLYSALPCISEPLKSSVCFSSGVEVQHLCCFFPKKKQGEDPKVSFRERVPFAHCSLALPNPSAGHQSPHSRAFLPLRYLQWDS